MSYSEKICFQELDPQVHVSSSCNRGEQEPVNITHQSEDISDQIAPVQEVVAPAEHRRSTRTRLQPLWMQDFVTSNKVKYLISNYMCYSHLTPSHQCYIVATSSLKELATYSEAVKDYRWVEAMQAEVQALENKKTWVVTAFPHRKKPIGCR
ncbi:hypothetical protein KY289_036083 [Solanum tuberosum]|nr:hypothetical protein KY289_036083 [Solanum tuberosum]